MSTILISGGVGFMGSHYIRHLLNQIPDVSVVNLDALTYAGNLENLRDVENDPRYRFIHGDITDAALIDRVFSDHHPETVINFAAETHVDRSILGPRHFVLTDVIGTYTLLEASRQHGVRVYLQISTDEVYGSTEQGEFTEESAFKPNSPYSASKAGADHLVRAYVKTYGLPAIRTHSCNVFGPYQFPEKFIPLFTTHLLEGRKVPLYGTGTNAREWIYVNDYCRALECIRQNGKLGEVYNIGTGWRLSNREVTDQLLMLFKQDEGSIEYVADRLGHDFRYAVNSEKLRALGWSPQGDFSTCLKTTVQWYKDHESWWKPLKQSLKTDTSHR